MAGAALALHGYVGLTLGTLAAFMTLNRSFNQPITQISQQLNSVVMAMAGAERVFRLLDEKSETDEGYVTLVNARRASGRHADRERGAHRRVGVEASASGGRHRDLYEARGRRGVRRRGLRLYAGEDRSAQHRSLCDAGPEDRLCRLRPGAGKTTITNLINRFYDIADGKIRYDGININKIRKDDLRRSLGMVLQDTHLFTGTVMENIRYGRLDATDEECIAAAKLANADGFIQRLPNGYDTMLTGDGANLSPGPAPAACHRTRRRGRPASADP